MVGKTVAHFQVLEKLGEGGMGVVYKARDTHLDRFLALKVLLAGKVGEGERKRRFVQEAKAASALNHPNIVHIYDIADSEGIPYIAMEFVKGRTLDQCIGHKGLKLNDALHYAVQIADALAKAHAAGIVHRDLKPTNIMVTDDGLVKVLDFGLAKLTERGGADESSDTETLIREQPLTEQGTIVGTAAYMSPEQAEGKVVDARSDVFSFGSVLYEMVTGQRAFRGDTKMSTIASLLREEAKPVSQCAEFVPRELERIITRCLRKEPARRFQHMDDLKIALEELKAESESGTLGVTTAPQRRRTGSLAWIAPVGALLALFAWYLVARRPGGESNVKVVPFTTYAGAEQDASFSPDGNQVAFSWDGEKQDNYDIYIKLIGPGTPLRLTTHRAMDVGAAWSPDGRTIAFVRHLGIKEQVMLVPALGGPERAVAEIADTGGHRPLLAWSPDGKWLVSADRSSPNEPAGLVAISVESGEKRTLTTPPRTFSRGDTSPALSPDGRYLVFSRSVLDTISDLYMLELTEGYAPKGEAKRLTFRPGWVPAAAWTADGRSLVYSAGQWENIALFRMNPFGSGKPAPLPFVGEGGYPAISRQGNRMMYTISQNDFNIWRVEAPGEAPPKPGTAKGPASLISSTRIEHTPAYSPDAAKIAFSSNRSGNWEIWVCDSDGSNAAQLTTFGGPFTRYPSWSPDGKLLAFDSRPEGQADIYVMSSQGGQSRRITSNAANDTTPSWSHDGQWIYFSSNRSGRSEIWKTRASGAMEQAVQVTKTGGIGPVESPDGAFVYYEKNNGEIWKVPPSGGEERMVLRRSYGFAFGVVDQGIYFVGWSEAARGLWLQFYSFASGEITPVAAIPKRIHMGFSVSHDGRWILYTQIDQSGSDLMLVENFR